MSFKGTREQGNREDSCSAEESLKMPPQGRMLGLTRAKATAGRIQRCIRSVCTEECEKHEGPLFLSKVFPFSANEPREYVVSELPFCSPAFVTPQQMQSIVHA